MSEENLITLKEAASVSGYSSDYIGQLIRAGKISGKQVYTGVTWMTTAEEVLNYKTKNNNGKNSNDAGFVHRQKNKLKMELNILKLFFQSFKSAWPIFIILISCVFALVFYSGYIIISEKFTKNTQETKSISSEQTMSY
jgi:hypothetical protein